MGRKKKMKVFRKGMKFKYIADTPCPFCGGKVAVYETKDWVTEICLRCGERDDQPKRGGR